MFTQYQAESFRKGARYPFIAWVRLLIAVLMKVNVNKSHPKMFTRFDLVATSRQPAIAAGAHSNQSSGFL
jgi:hypothetical protein